MDLGTPAIQSWLRPVSLLREELECGDCLACHPLITSQLEELISTSLLLAQPSNYSAACGVRKLRPRSENLDLQAEPTLRTRQGGEDLLHPQARNPQVADRLPPRI